MAKITQINNGDLGSVARTKINEALKSCDTGTYITGDGTSGSPLDVDTGALGSVITVYTVTEITDADSPYSPTKTTPALILLCDTYGGAITVNLPASNTWTGVITIKNVGSTAYDVTVNPNGVETIDGQTSWTIEPESVAGAMETYDFFNNGSNVFVR